MKLRILLAVFVLLLIAPPVGYHFLVEYRSKYIHRQMLDYLIEDLKSRDDNKGKILFIGSSSIYRWKHLDKVMAPSSVLQRGYGYGKLEDLNNHLWLTTLRYKPNSIVLFAGVNDLILLPRVEPEDVVRSFKKFVSMVHKSLPDICIFFIAISPSPAWIPHWRKIRKTNQLIEKYTENQKYIEFISTNSYFIESDGTVNNFLFISDRIHLSEQGYKVWNHLVKSALMTSGCSRP